MLSGRESFHVHAWREQALLSNLSLAWHHADNADAGCDTDSHTSADGLSESSMTLCSEASPGCLALLHIAHCCIAPSVRKVQCSHCHASCLLPLAIPVICAWSVPCAPGLDAVRALAAFRGTLHACQVPPHAGCGTFSLLQNGYTSLQRPRGVFRA